MIGRTLDDLLDESSSDDEDLLHIPARTPPKTPDAEPKYQGANKDDDNRCVTESKEMLSLEADLVRKEEHKVRVILPLLTDFLDTESMSALSDDYGLPTCVASSSSGGSHVVFGTLRGTCVLVDITKCKPVSSLSPTDDVSSGACTAVSVSGDGNSCVVGHKTGQIALWDLANEHKPKLQLVRPIFSATAVTCCQFVRKMDAQFCFAASSAGHLVLLTFATLFMSVKCESQLLLEPSPKVGTVLRVSQLIDRTWAPASSSLCAVACSHAVILLALHPTVQLLHKMRFQHVNENTAPDACWANGEPLLYVSFSQTVHVMQIRCEQLHGGEVKWDITCIQRISWPLNIHTLCSFSPFLFCIFDHAAKLSIVEVPLAEGGDAAWKTVDVVDASSWSIAYQSLSGNHRAYHGSLVIQHALKSKPVVLCSLNYFGYKVALIRWAKIMEKMVNDNSWSDALDIFVGVYNGTYPSLLDFPSQEQERKKNVSTRASQMILLFVDHALLEHTDVRTVTEQIIDACVQFQAWNLLYKSVFDKYTAARQFSVYRECLEPFLLAGEEAAREVTSEVYTEILQAYAPMLESEQAAAATQSRALDIDSGVIDCDVMPDVFPLACRVQQLVLCLGLEKLDLHKAIRLLTRYRLWTAMIFVYTHALHDFCGAVDVLVAEGTRIVKIVSTRGQTDAMEVPLVRKLFTFLRRTFQRKPFPVDEGEHAAMTAPEPSAVKNLMHHIFRRHSAELPPALFMKLLRLNTRVTLDCFGELFESAPIISAQEFLHMLNDAWKERPSELRTLSEQGEEILVLKAKVSRWLQREDAERERIGETAWSLIHLKKKEYELLCLDVLKTLLSVKPMDMEERRKLLAEAETEQWYQLASFLYEVEQNYERAVEMRILSWPQSSVFSYIENLPTELLAKADDAFFDVILTKLSRLCDLDFNQTFQLLTSNFSKVAGVDRVVAKLTAVPNMQKMYLEALFTDAPLFETPAGRSHFFTHHAVTYVSLLCRLSPSHVLPYLLDHETLPLDDCLTCCMEYQVTDAAAHLLEKIGEFTQVSDLLTKDLRNDLEMLKDIFEKQPSDIRAVSMAKQAQSASREWWSPKSQVGRCIDRVHYAHEVCARNINRMLEEDLTTLWFGFCRLPLEALRAFGANRDMSMQADYAFAYQRSLKDILSHMMRLGPLAFLPPPLMMHHLLNTEADTELYELKGPFSDIFNGLQFHDGLLSFSKSIAASDLMAVFERTYQRGKQRVARCEALCHMCGLPFASTSVSCFTCGHGYHTSCLAGKKSCTKCASLTSGA